MTQLLRRAANARTVSVHVIFVVFGHGPLTPVLVGVEVVHVDFLVFVRHYRLLPEKTRFVIVEKDVSRQDMILHDSISPL